MKFFEWDDNKFINIGNIAEIRDEEDYEGNKTGNVLIIDKQSDEYRVERRVAWKLVRLFGEVLDE